MANVTLAYDADLARGIIREALRPVFATGDKNGHTFEISVKRDGAAVTLTGASVSAYFIRADRSTVPISGSVSGSKASVTLLAACYNVPGRFSLVIRLAMDGDIATIFAGDGAMLQAATDTIVDPENVVPSLSDLLAQVAAMEKATAAANTAASNADTKASAANTAASAANTAASNADTKASAAAAAAQKIDGMTGTVTMLAENAAPTVTVTEQDGHKVLSFALPQGKTGATGPQGPKGETGSVENLSINGKPVESGDITLTAEDVGAFPLSDGTAITDCDTAYKSGIYIVSPSALHIPESNTWAVLVNIVSDGASYNEATNWIYQFYLPNLGTLSNAWWRKRVNDGQFSSWKALGCEAYPVGAIYISTVSTSPASLFGGTWQALESRFLLPASATYAAGSTGGAKTHKHTTGSHQLTEKEMPTHAHSFSRAPLVQNEVSGSGNYFAETSTTVGTLVTKTTETKGGNGTHSHGDTGSASSMPPYLAVYMWERIA